MDDVKDLVELGLLNKYRFEGKEIYTWNADKDAEIQARLSHGYAMDKFSFESDLLNELTGGGLPRSGLYLVLGDPGSGKMPLCMQFLHAGLRRGDTAMFVSFDELPIRVIESMRQLGWDPAKYRESNRFLILDGFSRIAGIPSEERYAIRSVGDLTDLSIKTGEALIELSQLGRPRVATVSLSALMAKVDFTMILDFLRVYKARTETIGAASIFTLNRRGFDDRYTAQLKELSTGFLELKLEEDKKGRLQRFIRVTKMYGSEPNTLWTRFRIKPGVGFTKIGSSGRSA